MSSYSAAELAALDRRSLQKLCKRADVVAFAAARGESLRANAKTDQLVSQLTAFFTQLNGDGEEEQQQSNQQIDDQSSSAAEADEAEPAAGAEQSAEEAAPAEAEMECTTAGAAELVEEHAEQQEQEQEDEAEEQMEETAAAAPASLLPASGLADELAAASVDAHMVEDEEDEDEDEMEPVGPLAGDIHMDDFPELPAEEEEERAAPAFAAAGADHERDAKEQEELEALEAEIGDLQAQLVQTEQPAAPVARAAKAPKKSVAPVAASKKKSIAPKKSVVPSVAAMADKRKSTKKVVAPAAAATAAPVAAAAAPLFKKKAVAKKAAPAAATAAPVTVAAAAEPVITIPTSFDFPSSASTTATVAAAVAPTASPAPAAAAASSGSSSMDAYWSLMAELDKRVVEKQRVAATAAPTAVEDASAPAAAVAATPGAALGKKTTAKFDKIHKAAAHKSESIVDHYNKLNEKKRAAQMATPLASGLKRAKHAHHATAGTALPQPSPAPFVLAPMASPAAAVALPASGFTEGFKAVQTPGVAKRTRASLKKEKNRHVAPAPVVAPAKAAARKSVAAKKLAPAASPAATDSRPLFTSRVPVRPSASASAVAPAPSTTFTQIACLEDVRAGSAASASASTAATAAAAKKKFDIAASLAKPVSWKMHKGKIGKATAAEGKAKAAAASADKENAPATNPFVAAAAEEKAGNTSKGVDAAFGFSFQPGVHAFTAPVATAPAPTAAAPQSVLQVSKAQPSASAAGTSRRDGIKTVRMGADKDAKRSNFNANKQSSRNKAMAAARDRIAV